MVKLVMWCAVVPMLAFFALGLAAADEAYVIGDEDVLQISVWGNPELTVQVPVRPDGMISVPLVGDVRASGFTPSELKAVLEKEFTKFIKTPTVSVVLTAVNSFKVYIIGGGQTNVQGVAGGTAGTGTASGVITLKGKTTLLQLLAQYGSIRDADLQNCYLLRNGQKLDIDFHKLMIKGDISQDIPLKPKDLIFMPDSFENRIRVLGAVRTPGVVQYRKGLTALDAVIMSGGFNEFAKQNDVIIVRQEKGKTTNIEVRLKDVINDGQIEKDVSLKPGDNVIVKKGIF